MRVAIVGSRDWRDLDRVAEFVYSLAKKYPGAILVSGGARGVDEKAELAAQVNCLEVISYRPRKCAESDHAEAWTIDVVTHGAEAERYVAEKNRRGTTPILGNFAFAAHFRNVWIVEDAEQIVAFWDGKSPGTKFTIDTARTYGKEPHVYEEE